MSALFFLFRIHSYNGPGEELQTPKAPDLPSEYGLRESVFLLLMTSLATLGGNEVG